MKTEPSHPSALHAFLAAGPLVLMAVLCWSAALAGSHPQGSPDAIRCVGCHRIGATDADAPASPLVATHLSFLCTDCHDSHGTTSNLHLIMEIILTPSSGPRGVIFVREVGENSYADGDTVYDGVCEVCHTTTQYHRNDSSGDHTHQAASNCTNCHTHDAGFDPIPVTAVIGAEQPAGSMRVFPSPSRGPVTIRLELAATGEELRAVICDVHGRRVRELAVEGARAGSAVVRWDGRDDDGARVASGVYFCRVVSRGQTLQNRFLFIR